jgi:hypothetical protein
MEVAVGEAINQSIESIVCALYGRGVKEES